MYYIKKIVICFTLLCVGFLFTGCSIQEVNKNVEGLVSIHFIDVGQGNATFVVGPEGQTMLYDAGGDNDAGQTVVDYIQALGYNKIDVAIFTHPHADHINGAPKVFEQLAVLDVYFPKVIHTTRTFDQFVESVRNAGLKFKTAKAGIEIPFGEVVLQMVAPNAEAYSNLNDYSTALKLTYGRTSLLLTGDVEAVSEQEMIESHYDLSADIFLVPHHGSNSSTSQAFLDKVKPRYGIISAGKDNSYGHPHNEVLERLALNGIAYYSTQELGDIIISLDGTNIRINDAMPQPVEVEEKEEKVTRLDMEVSIDNSQPTSNQYITIIAKIKDQNGPVEGIVVDAVNHYKSKQSQYSGVTDVNGIAEIRYNIGRASSGYTVLVEVNATVGDNQLTKTVEFTPQ